MQNVTPVGMSIDDLMVTLWGLGFDQTQMEVVIQPAPDADHAWQVVSTTKLPGELIRIVHYGSAPDADAADPSHRLANNDPSRNSRSNVPPAGTSTGDRTLEEPANQGASPPDVVMAPPPKPPASIAGPSATATLLSSSDAGEGTIPPLDRPLQRNPEVTELVNDDSSARPVETDPNALVTVPDLKGRPISEVVSTLHNLGLRSYSLAFQ